MCKHKTCVISEEFRCFDEIVVVNGKIYARRIVDPCPTGSFFVRCRDCGMERAYGARRPKWLEVYLEAGAAFRLSSA
jgi:hypothetical protein